MLQRELNEKNSFTSYLRVCEVKYCFFMKCNDILQHTHRITWHRMTDLLTCEIYSLLHYEPHYYYHYEMHFVTFNIKLHCVSYLSKKCIILHLSLPLTWMLVSPPIHILFKKRWQVSGNYYSYVLWMKPFYYITYTMWWEEKCSKLIFTIFSKDTSNGEAHTNWMKHTHSECSLIAESFGFVRRGNHL